MSSTATDQNQKDFSESLQTSNATQTLVITCVRCSISVDLRRCSGCRVVQYCNFAHQAADWEFHKSDCNKLKKAKAKVEAEDRMLRAQQGGILSWANPLENEGAIGHFWGIVETRDYMVSLL